MLAPGKIYVNSVVRVPGLFVDSEDVLTNPSLVTFKTRSPCGGLTTYAYGTDEEITNASAGSYVATIYPGEAGVWHYRWEVSGPDTTTAVEGRFNVLWSPFYADCGGSATSAFDDDYGALQFGSDDLFFGGDALTWE